MDSIEHQTWLSDVGRKFPAVRQWIREITPEADHHALLDAWETAMRDLRLDDCLAVNLKMLSGELDGPGDWPAQWQGLPARVRRHVRTMRDEAAGIFPMSDSDKREDLRNLLVRTRRQAGVPIEQINAELARAGFEPVATLKDANVDNPT
jgi:hypothetical protein